MPHVSAYNWTAIRAMYEAGEGITSISRKEGMPSKQAISQKQIKEGWERIDEHDDSLDVIPFEGLTLQQQIVVREIAGGLPARLAAAIGGVHQDTVYHWRKTVPEFLKAEQAAISVMARKQLAKITDSPDWRSGLVLLERHPATKQDFAPPNASRGLQGTTFNVLGHVSVGLDRLPESNVDPPMLEAPND